MSFSSETYAALEAPLNSKCVKTRSQSGRTLSYIEGWWAISEANRIFGFDNWSRETIELKCVSERQREIGAAKSPGWGVTYIARVRVTVGTLIREGSGSGHGIDKDLGSAHESALKEAETDAMKRALMTFGNPFGLALYDKEQSNVEHDAPKSAPEPQRTTWAQWVAQAEREILECPRSEAVTVWLQANNERLEALEKRDKAVWNTLQVKISNRKQELEKAA